MIPWRVPRPRFGRQAWRWWLLASAWVAVAGWVRAPSPVTAALVLGAGLIAIGVWLPRAGEGRVVGTIAALALAAGAVLGVELRLAEIGNRWSEVRARAENRSSAALRRTLDQLVDRGAGAVRAAVTARTFTELDAVRRRAGLDALAVFGRDGRLWRWSGSHHGALPDTLRRTDRPFLFVDGALVRYLYFVIGTPAGGRVVAAKLLDATLPWAAPRSLAERFARRYGARPVFAVPGAPRGPAVWEWRTARGAVFAVGFEDLTAAVWRQRLLARARNLLLAVVVAGLAGTLALRRRDSAPRAAAVGLGCVMLALWPWPSTSPMGAAASPLLFLLPWPPRPAVTAWPLAVALAGAAAALLARGSRRAGRELPGSASVATALVAAAALPVGGAILRAGVSDAALLGPPAGGLMLQTLGVLIVGLPWLAAWLVRTRVRWAGLSWRWALPLAAVATWVLALAFTAAWRPTRSPTVAAMALWAWPLALVLALPWRRGPANVLAAWLLIAWVSAAAVRSLLWVGTMDARARAAARELAHLGVQPDPYVEFLLRRFGEEAQRRADASEGVALLYDAWRASGLAEEPLPVRLTLWKGTTPTAELRLSDTPLPVALVPVWAARALRGGAPELSRMTLLPEVHYAVVAPLGGDRWASAVVPPRLRGEPTTVLARLLHPWGRSPIGDEVTLSVLPAGPQESPAPPQLRWERTADGWRADQAVPLATGWGHAHALLREPPLWLLLARMLLVQTLLLSVVTLPALAAVRWRRLRRSLADATGFLRSFRGRLTLALFVFFLAPTVLLSAVAYSMPVRELQRAATVQAWDRLERAAAELPRRPLGSLGAAVELDLLLYREALLRAASADELLRLGLFDGWLRPALVEDFRRDRQAHAAEVRHFGPAPYLLAYHRTPGGDVLAAPVPLSVGDIARRRRELTDLVLVLAHLGALLSLVLALAVGRALTRPIAQLAAAAGAVGAGDLRVQLPADRQDEFGVVYHAFNRMVQRLR